MARKTVAAIIGAALCGALALSFAATRDAGSDGAAYAAPGLEPMTAQMARDEFWRLTPALLLVVYEAFAETQEAQIYDTLARVTHADALEYLYLERVGAMAGGGLDEADQEIHEIKLLNTQVAQDGTNLKIDASWQVIGTVGHAEHLHVRGNTYNAGLSIAPIDGAWRITDFDLRDVSREEAGETFLAPQTN